MVETTMILTAIQKCCMQKLLLLFETNNNNNKGCDNKNRDTCIYKKYILKNDGNKIYYQNNWVITKTLSQPI